MPETREKDIKALVVEDDPMGRRLLREMLGKISNHIYNVEAVESLTSAFSLLEQTAVNIAILDLNLPDSKGLDTLISFTKTHPGLATIVITSEDDEAIGLKAIQNGAQDYLIKGKYDIGLLNKSIHYAIERKRIETSLNSAYKELKRTQDMLIQAEKMKSIGQLASTVAHEVRNPLGIILQGVNYLEQKMSRKQKKLFSILQMIKKNVKRADKIISSLLDYSRPTPLELQPFSVPFIIKESLHLVQSKIKIGNINIIGKDTENLPSILVDKTRIEQVFINIFMNAIQAMPKGGTLTITSYLTEFTKPKNGVGRRSSDLFRIGEKAVIIQIQDTGVGIPDENMAKIFDPFFTTKDATGGSGLGLSVCQKIINMHEGLFEVDSQIDKGTTIILTLKICQGG